MQALHIALTSILLFLFSAIPSALSSSSSVSNSSLISPSTVNLALPTLAVAPEFGDGIICFNVSYDKAFPIDVSDCNDIIEYILHDPSGVMKRQKFSHDPQAPGTYTVPKIWRYKRCFILLESEDEDAVGEFRLVDAIVRVQDVLAKCPPNSKQALGGIAVMGIGKFFVTVDGPPYLGGPNQTMQLGRHPDSIDIGSS